MKQCKGCGAILQTNDPQLSGYTPKEDAQYCKRCFRIRHYDDVTVSYQKTMDNEQILKQIQQMPGVIVWVVDLFDFESNMIPNIETYCEGRDIILVLTKRDLLPETFSNEKLADFVLDRLRHFHIRVQAIIVTGDYANDGIEEVQKALRSYHENTDILVMGVANAGKSTVLNALLQSKDMLTMSRYPGTTLGFTKLEWEGHVVYDSPGLHRYNSMVFMLPDDQLKLAIPSKRIKPLSYQCKGNPSFAIGGLVRIDLFGANNTTMTMYLCDRMPVHRGKVENADALWKNHMNDILLPHVCAWDSFQKETIVKREYGIDVCIHGLGWVCIKGSVRNLDVYYPNDAKITIRKAMI